MSARRCYASFFSSVVENRYDPSMCAKTTISIFSLAFIVSACGSTCSDDRSGAAQPIEPPEQTSATPDPPAKIAVSPLSVEARESGIKPLVHTASLSTVGTDDTSDPEALIVVRAGESSALRGITHGKGTECWVESGWEVDFGLGPLEDLLMKWVTIDKRGAVTITPPREALGVAFMLSGCDPKKPEWTRKIIAIGAEGLHSYRSARRYIESRSGDTALPPGFPDEDPVHLVKLTPVVVFRSDLDGDGKGEVLVYAFRSWLDDEGDQLAQAGELGIVWSNPEKRSSSAVFGLSQGVAFPFFHVVPPELNGGSHLFYGVHRCCGGTTLRHHHLSGTIFSDEIFETKEGDHSVFLTPSADGRARIAIE